VIRRAIMSDDDGFTLAELIVYSLILIGVMAIAGTLFINLITTQRDVRAIADANNEAQLTFKQIERDIRNASWARVVGDGTGLVLQVRRATATNFTDYVCVAYYVSTGTSELRRNQSTNNAQTHEFIGAANAAARLTASDDWSIKRSGFTAIGTTRVFGTTDGVVSQPHEIKINMSMMTENGHKDITFSKSVSLRPQRDLTTASCS